MGKKELVFNVLRWDFNAKKAEMWNIFDNVIVSKRIKEEVEEYLKNPNKYEYEKGFGKDAKTYKGYEAIKEHIDQIIMSEEWSRCEYEIAVGDIIPKSLDELEKVDCYFQAHSNIDLITDLCINFYKEK